MDTRTLLTKRSRQRLMRAFGVVAMVAMFAMNMPTKPVDAAQLTTVRMYLNRQQAGLATGEIMELFFTPATTLTGSTNHVILSFPNNAANNTKWCKTNAGTLTLTAITATSESIQTAEAATGILGTVTGACTQTPDTFTISAVGALQAGTKYGVRIAGNTSAIGTGDAAASIKYTVDTQQASTPTDTYTGATALTASDQIAVTATIDPTLSVTTTNLAVALGTLTSAAVSYSGASSAVVTNAKNGYVSVVYSSVATMTNGTDTIAAAGGTVTAATSGYGVSTNNSGSHNVAATSAGVTNCDNTTRTAAGPYNATSLTSAGLEFASLSAPTSGDTTVLCFLAAVSTTQAPGAYTAAATMVTTARF